MTTSYDFEKIRQQQHHLPDPAMQDEKFQAMLAQCRAFTLTSDERMYALHTAVQYLVHAKIPGAMVECGVWQGGSCMNIALTLQQQHVCDRDIYLFDTFEGMTPPESMDVDLLNRSATALLETPTESASTQCVAALEIVQRNMLSTRYPAEKIHYIPGAVETTLPARAPAQIALLRLDTDWYASTKQELTHLYPRLASGGVLIIDDYGHWRGARQATDEYFAQQSQKTLMHRIDYSGRLVVKR